MKKKLVSILLLASSLAAFSCGKQNGGEVVTTDPGTNSDSTNVESTPPRLSKYRERR